MAEHHLGNVAVKEREALSPPVAVAVQVEDPNVFDMEAYKALVQELGVDDSAIKNYEFRRFLNEEGIQVFEYEKVTAFLDQKLKLERAKAKNPNLIWTWKPLNGSYPAAPRRHGSGEGLVFWSLAGEPTLVTVDTPTRNSRTYARAIPQAVLMTVKKIKDKFKDAVQFYASDYEVRDPDPFLMVTGPGLDYYVVERWDEPGFRS